MSTKLYVGNLAFQTTSQELQELFAQVGTVESASVVEDRDTGRSRGFGFVEMSTKEEAASAIQQLNGKEVAGRALTIKSREPILSTINSAIVVSDSSMPVVLSFSATLELTTLSPVTDT